MKKKGVIFLPIVIIVFGFLVKIVISGILLGAGHLENLAMAKSAKAADAPTVTIDIQNELKQREMALKKKEEELAKKEREYKILKQDVESRIAELNEIQQKLAAYAKKLAEKEKALRDAKMAHLVSLYSAMEPSKAAAIMDKLNMNTVVKILRNMKGKSAGKILAMMDPEKGAKISEALSKGQ